MERRDFINSCAVAAVGFASQQSASTRGELQQAQYVIVELMGRKKVAGRMQQGPMPGLFQLDVPVEGGFVSQLINTQAVYRITIASEEAVREISKGVDPLPVIELQMPLTLTQTRMFDDEGVWH